MEIHPQKVSFWRRRGIVYWMAAGIILLLHIIIFRDVLAASPDILQNKSSVVRDELVPFFSFSNGYMPAATSELTGSDEFRVTYSFWTSWVRYNPILPFMLVALNALSAYILFYAIYRLVRRIAEHPLRAAFVSLLVAVAVHLVLMYAKIAHFYSLIFGFSLFALALTLYIEQLFFATKIQVKNTLAVTALVLINPAIHYHVIFYLAGGLLLLLSMVFTIITRRFSWPQLRRNLAYTGMTFAASLVPYLVYISLTTPASDAVFNQMPVNYWMIFYSSVPLLYMLSFDSLGHVDLFRYGDYMAPQATASMLLLFAIIAALFLCNGWRQLTTRKKGMVYSLFVVLLLSVWMAIGFSNKTLVSFHAVLGGISSVLSHIHSGLTQAANELILVFISILRFPHRFQFMFYYAAAVLLAVVLLWLFGWLRDKKIPAAAVCAILVLAVAAPLVGSTAYRETFTTGNFGGFFAPYKIPDDLVKIKGILQKETVGRLFILPSLESGRVIATNSQRYSFLDKYFIYYLEQPSIYTGYGADTGNKIVSHMVYRSMWDATQSWQGIAANSLGVTHMLVPKHTQARSEQTVYLDGVENDIANSLGSSTAFEKLYDGPDYSLYKRTATFDQNANVMLDMQWPAANKQLDHAEPLGSRLFFPIQQKDFNAAAGSHQLLSDNPERSFYHLYASRTKIGAPDSNLLPFSTDLIPSSNFTANMFSLSTLYDSEDDYNYTHETVPSLLNLQTAQFVGVAGHSAGEVAMQLPASAGPHRLLLHAASRQPTIIAKLNGQQITLTRLAGDPATTDQIDFTYYTADVSLNQGDNLVTVPSGNKTILVEYVAAVPKNDLPSDFANANAGGVHITQAAQPQMYNVEVSE